MSLILSIETATEVCSVSLSENGTTIALKENSGINEHSSQLTLFIEEVTKEAGKSLKQVDAIAVSMGPGSYTGLRIGVSVSKGLCYSLDRPLISVSTLQAIACGAIFRFNDVLNDGLLLCPMIDARRMEVYMAIYDKNLNEIQAAQAIVLDENSFQNIKTNPIALIGNGSSKCREIYQHDQNIIFPGDVLPSAKWIGYLADAKFRMGDFENTAYFEPYYLKEFIAGKPRVKGLHI